MRHVPFRGKGLVPIGTVFCLGRNFADHAREMGAAPIPVVFLKPPSALLPGGGKVPWPVGSREVHYEAELVLCLGDRGAIAGVGLGVDLTARDLQDEAKKKGQPWARSKGFPGSAPVSEFVAWDDLPCPFGDLDLSLSVAGQIRQEAHAREMILDPFQTVAALSTWFGLEPGDLIFMGTPAGVGSLKPGELVAARCSRLGLQVECQLLPPG